MGTVNRNVLFGAHDNFEPRIKARIDKERYDCVFAGIETVDLTTYDFIVPLLFKNYASLDKQSDEIRRRSIYPNRAVVELCHDKLQFNKLIASSPFSGTIPPLLEEPNPSIPFILKRSKDSSGSNSHLILSENDRTKFRDLMQHTDYFKQIYVSGAQEHTTHILLRDREPLYHLNVTYHMQENQYIKGKNSASPKKTTLSKDDLDLGLFLDILEFIGFENGTCCFNYKYIDGKIAILELNPRFGSSLIQDINTYLEFYGRAIGL